ncbi:interferon-induced transmembrane protein 5-like [Gadus chalcogrammus]|uniref:interferon-induced transmembrane protein 5-like n=1 Tax=Gadus chalcogrammus TaxID=1042646 RepID=UPI0024C4B2BD|nr:interferon-induced transmembrane protein 5-like [Gadus chalcogrammus]
MIKAHCFLRWPTLLHKEEILSARPSAPQLQEMQYNRDPDTVVTIVNPVEHPRDYVVWSICSFFHANPFCLGLLALIFSFKARDMKVMGDLQRAKGYSKWALGLNVAALISLVLIVLILVIVLIINAVADANSRYRNHY